MKLFCVLLVALSARAVFADCDCKIVPFPRSCAKECMGKALATAHYSDLTEKLGLSSSTSLKVLNTFDPKKVRSIDDYEKVLNKKEMAEVKLKLNSIDEHAVASIFGNDQTRRTGAAKH